MQAQINENEILVQKNGEGENHAHDQKEQDPSQAETLPPNENPSQKKPRPKRQNNRNEQQYVEKNNATENPDQGSPEAAKKAPRTQKREQRHKMEVEVSWRDELEKSMTLETKIPAYPTKEELLQLPEKHKLHKSLDLLDDKMDDLFDQIEELDLQRKDIKNKIRNQNKVEYGQLNKLLTEKR